ncbi:hypothetical protein ACLB2K_050494 [Fragaria x ananassa]
MKNDDSFMKRMVEEMDLKFKKYWSDCCTILGIGVVLDPQFKMKFVEWAYDILDGRDSSQLKDFSDALSLLYGVYVESFNLHSSSYPTHQSSFQAQGKHSILERRSVSVDDLTDDIFYMTLFDCHDALEEQENFS